MRPILPAIQAVAFRSVVAVPAFVELPQMPTYLLKAMLSQLDLKARVS